MRIVFNAKDLKTYLSEHGLSKEYPVVISKFIIDAKEIDIDAVASNGQVVRMVNESDTSFRSRDVLRSTFRRSPNTWKMPVSIRVMQR